MKNLKMLVNWLLVLALVFAALPTGIAFASDSAPGEIPFSHTFESSSTETLASELNYRVFGTESIKFAGEVVDGTSVGMDTAVVKMTKGILQIPVTKDGSAITTGKYTVSIDIALTDIDTEIGVLLGASNSIEIKPSSGDNDGSGNEVPRMLAFHNKNTSYGEKGWVLNGYYGNLERLGDAGCATEINTPYTITAYIDMDTHQMSHMIKKGGVVIARKDGVNISRTTALNYFTVRLWQANAIYIDNIIVKPYEEPAVNEIFMKENFDGMTVIDTTASNRSVSGNLFNKPWYNMSGYDTPAIDTETFADDSNHKTVLSFAKANVTKWGMGLNYGFGRSNNTDNGIAPFTTEHGIIRFTFSIYPGASDGAVKLWNTASGGRPFFALGWGSGSMTTIGVPGVKTAVAVASYDDDKWYDVELIMNMDEKTLAVKVENDGKVIGSVRYLELKESDNGVYYDYLKTIGKMEVFTYNNNGTTKLDKGAYIDNFCLEKLANYGESPSANEFVLKNNDFSNGLGGFALSSSATEDDAVVSSGSEQGNVLQLTKSGVEAKIPVPGNSTGYKISYKVKVFQGAAAYIDAMYKIDGKDAGLGLLYLSDSAFNNPKIGSVSSTVDKWYQVEHTINFGKESLNTVVKDLSTDTQLINSTTDMVNEQTATNKTNPKFEDIEHFRIRKWQAGGKIYVDDVKIEYLVAEPSLSQKGVKLNLSDGTVVKDLETLWDEEEAIEGAVSSISLNFGTAVKKSTVEGAVSLTDDDGASVDFSGTLKASKYTIVPSGLTPGKIYTLSVEKDTVENEIGQKMTSRYEVSFELSAGNASVELLSLQKSDGTVIAAVSDIAGGEKIYVVNNSKNTTADNVTKTYLVAYYSGNKLEFVSKQDVTLNSGAATENERVEFTAPASLGDVTKIKVFCWNGISKMMPLAETYIGIP